jgi:tRNA nucleotidyltransferase (CCA-adding enzyme)
MLADISERIDALCHTVEYIVGKKCYLVGGAVRDLYMGREPKDYDFATSVTPDEVEAAVKAAGRKAYTVGKKFGTIGFKSEDGKSFFEVTTFRTEAYDGQSRKPVVEFGTSLKKDLERRDFTMNAMAYRPAEGYIDYFGGKDDIDHGLIKCVGEPTIRFREDPLRMVRACRFAAQLGFRVDDWTLDRMAKNSYTLTRVAVERVVVEIDKLLMSDFAGEGLAYLWQSGVMDWLIPELGLQHDFDQKSPYHKLVLHRHTIRVVELSPRNLDDRWLALLHDIGKPFCHTTKQQEGFGERYVYALHDRMGKMMGRRVMENMRFSNGRTDYVSGWIGRHQDDDCPIKSADDEGKA